MFHIMPAFYRSKSFQKTLPFLVLLVGGSLGLKQFVDIRYNYKPTVYDLRREMKKAGIDMKPPGEVTLESEYEKLKETDLDNWENKRIPRPWDEGGSST